MKVTTVANGTLVEQIIELHDGTLKKITVRNCRTEKEAKAVANYITIKPC